MPTEALVVGFDHLRLSDKVRSQWQWKVVKRAAAVLFLVHDIVGATNSVAAFDIITRRSRGRGLRHVALGPTSIDQPASYAF